MLPSWRNEPERSKSWPWIAHAVHGVEHGPGHDGLRRDVDPAGLPAGPNPLQPDQRGDRGLGAGVTPDLRDADADGRAIAIALERNRSPQRRDREITGGQAGARTVVAEGGDLHADEASVRLAQPLEAEPVLLEPGRGSRLDHDVGARDQLQQRLAVGRDRGIERDRALAPVVGQELETPAAAVEGIREQRCDAARGAARGGLHADHVRAQVRQDHPGDGPAVIGQIEDSVRTQHLQTATPRGRTPHHTRPPPPRATSGARTSGYNRLRRIRRCRSSTSSSAGAPWSTEHA